MKHTKKHGYNIENRRKTNSIIITKYSKNYEKWTVYDFMSFGKIIYEKWYYIYHKHDHTQYLLHRTDGPACIWGRTSVQLVASRDVLSIRWYRYGICLEARTNKRKYRKMIDR